MGRKKNKQFLDLEEQRYGLFMDENSFDLEIEFGREYLKSDVNFIVKYHKMDVTKTKSHPLYGEAKPDQKKFFPPISLDTMVSIEDGENKFLTDGGAVRQDTGNIIVGVYLKELKEKNLEVTRGDIIEYNLSGEKPRYYEVENAQNVTDMTSQTIAGFKSYYKKIIGVPAKEDIIPFLNETKI